MPDSQKPHSAIQWLIKTESDRQLGPYSTEAVLKLISEGALSGGEQIKRYPDGKWTAISRQPDFYDKLLDALEEIPKFDPQNFEKFDADTVIAPMPLRQEAEDFEKTVIVQKSKVTTNEQKSQLPVIDDDQPPINPNAVQVTKPATIEMQPMSQMQRKQKVKSVQIPLFLMGVAILFMVIVYLMPETIATGKPHLLVPRANVGSTMSPTDVTNAYKKASFEYQKDTYEGYLESQNRLVAAIESDPRSVQSRGLLCLVYKELWPFVKQDAADLDAVFNMAKATRSLDPTGVNGVYCEIVKLMTLGKYKEARGVLEYALNQQSMATEIVLYQLKAELLFEERDTRTALLYIDKVKQLGPEWIKPRFDSARYLVRAEQPTEAAKNYMAILQKNPTHRKTQIELGVLLFKSFHKSDDALVHLSAAASGTARVVSQELSQAHFFLSLIYAEKKNFEQAKVHAQEAFKLNPGDPQMKELVIKLGGSTDVPAGVVGNNELVFLGDQHQRTGNCLAAQAEFKAAFELDPSNALAAMKAARCLWQLNQSSEAVLWLRKAVKSDPKLATAYVLMADYLSARFDYVGAMQSLNRASQFFPNNYEVLRGYGLVESRRNNMKDAVSYLLRANKIYENDIETLILLAKAQVSLGDYGSAQKFSVRAIELDSTNTEAQIVYARVLTQFQGLETGVLYLKDLISKFSYTIDFRLALADLLREQERASQAQKIYEQLVDADPRNRKARIGLGQSYQAQAMFDKALKQYLSASVTDPSDVEGLFRAGLLYIDIRKYSDAIVQLKRALTVNPLYPRLHHYIGQAYYQNGDYEHALSSALEERKINPNLADSYILAADIYAASKQFQKCAGEYQQAIKLRPQGASLYVKVARCYRQSGSPDVAKSMLNIAASQESGMADIYKEMGAVYETEGDFRAAIQAYNKYLTLSPNAPDRAEIEARILKLSQGQ
jgi:tetratricopeptide (TPR) repeat protein